MSISTYRFGFTLTSHDWRDGTPTVMRAKQVVLLLDSLQNNRE